MRTISAFAFGLIYRTLLALAFIVAPLDADAQDAEDNGLVYVAHFKVAYSDLEEWIGLYHEHAVPVLQQLQEEGVITGWGVFQHSTGSEYNWRFAILAEQWGQYDQFWEEFFGRMRERSAEAFARSNAMIEAHTDEIWRITSQHFTDPEPETAYLYDSLFQIGFDDLGAWNRYWSETVGPILDQAMEDGLLGGWVVESHNTGGRYNWKVLYFFEEWDDIDDLFESVLGQIPSDAALWHQIQAHDDVIWAAVPDPAEDQ